MIFFFYQQQKLNENLSTILIFVEIFFIAQSSLLFICFQIYKLNLYFKMILIIIGIIVFLWTLLGLFALVQVNKIVKKYAALPQVNYKPEWQAIIRKDYNKWDLNNIKKGCFLRFPYRFIAFFSILVNLTIMVYLVNIFPTMKNKFQNFFVGIMCRKLMAIIYSIDEKFQRQRIQTPIVIANHVNWFDMFYTAQVSYPVSFVSKDELERMPIIGKIGKYIKCIFLNRTSQDARVQTLELIKQRINTYNLKIQETNPLLIFPQGTTSNGRSIMRFKAGAFNDKANITAFALHYQCEGFDMGMQELKPFQHIIISLSLFPKLTVQRIKFKAGSEESSEQYMQRVQKSMATALGYRVFDCGYTQKNDYNLQRSSKKQK